MLDIHEIEKVLQKALDAASDEYFAAGEAWFANPENRELDTANQIATNKMLALQDALDVVTQISWYSDETAEQIVDRIVKEITFKVEFVEKKMSEPAEAKTA